jgi:uncharacterized protein
MGEVIPLVFFLVAALYASVGHAGASGYLAVMALLIGVQEKEAGPTALVLNLIVATFGTIQFQRAKLIAWRALLPYLAGSVPLAYFGGQFALSESTYRVILGVLLVAAAGRLLLGPPPPGPTAPPRPLVAVLVGALIGVLAGLTRTGGGIFLTPVLILTRWAPPKQAAGMSVAFILANSAAGLAGRLRQGAIVVHADALSWGVAAALGGLVGAWYGARRSGLTTLRRLLAVVLLLASLKLLAA